MKLEAVKGIGKARAEAYAKLGIDSAEALVAHIPREYENRGHIVPLSCAADGEKHACLLTVATKPRAARIPGGRTLVRFRAYDESGSCEITYFCRTAQAIGHFEVGETRRVWGRYVRFKGQITITNPVCEEISATVRPAPLVPVYKLSGNLSSKIVQKNVISALESIDKTNVLFEETLPYSLLQKRGIMPLYDAYRILHDPKSMSEVAEARKSLSYRELFLYFSLLQRNRSQAEAATGIPVPVEIPKAEIDELPYTLTDGQLSAIRDVYTDLRSPRTMHRIVVGDVGCGKTEIARMSALMMLRCGYRVALMAPTEILATQHFEGLAPYFEKKGYKTALLLGSTGAKDKRLIKEGLKLPLDDENAIPFVIGTHALLTDNVEIDRLGLAVIDEQHRFGVFQRQNLLEKGNNVNVLSLSATPIPRSYAKILYGDLDTSLVTELPPGRTPPKTFLVNTTYRERLLRFIERMAAEGHQTYVVCPAIEPTSDDDEEDRRRAKMVSAEERFKALCEALPNLKIGLLHGKMKNPDKAAVMEAFSSGEIQVLVATTVIEVGVNVPNALLMIIEGADRFGLSQLHQLRGRVARSSAPSTCVLVSDSESKDTVERLNTLVQCSSGFSVAEKDLKMRGPGDLFVLSDRGGVRQSGDFGFKVSQYCTEEHLLTDAFEDAKDFWSSNAQSAEHKVLLERLNELSEKIVTE